MLRFGKPGESRDRHLFLEVFAPKVVIAANKLDHQGWKAIKEFAADLAKTAPCWVVTQNPDDAEALVNMGYLSVGLGEESIKWLTRLARLDATTFEPLVVAALAHYCDKAIEEVDLNRLLNAIERYVFIVFGLAERRSHTGKNIYFHEAFNLYHDSAKLNAIIQRIETEIPSRVSADAFYDAIKNRNSNSEGFYSWGELRVVLFEYESALHEERFRRDEAKVDWKDWRRRKLGETVEHIYPQEPPDQYWVERFGSLDPSADRLFLNSIGNLLLLSRSKNSTLQNDKYPSKAFRGDHCYQHGSFSEIAVASDWTDWTPAAICERSEVVFAFIGRRWRVPEWENATQRVLQELKALLPPSEAPKSGG